MDTSKIIKGVVSNGRYTVTAPIVKEDYGLYLQIEGVELPETYQVDFSNSESSGTSVTMIGNADGVLIPSQFISTGKDIFAFLYHVGSDYGRTVYKFRIPNKYRPDRTNEQPTPEEQSTIDQTISALNDAVERAEDAEQAIEDMSVSATTLAEGSSATVTKTEQDGVVHLAFGIPVGATGAHGERGAKGDKGDKGDTGIGEKGDKGDKGDKGEQGDDYVLTEQDKQDIADIAEADLTPTILNAFPTDIASGAIASFPDGADDIPLKSLVVNIDPVQDLHGYDSPWVGGGGKNKFGGEYGVKWFFPTPLELHAGDTFTISASVPASGNTRFNAYVGEGGATRIYNAGMNDTVNGRKVRTVTVSADVTYTAIMFDVAECTDIQFELNSSATSYAPYENICPISGWTGMQLNANGTVIPISWQTEAGTVYGGKLDVLSGVLRVYPYYASYNGETLTGRWISDRDVYAVGTTPTIGAQVINIGAEGTEIQLEPHEIVSILGANNIFADTGDTEVEYRADTKLYIERLTAPDSADMIADANITSGKYFMVGNTLYKATANIANGASIIVGTNCIRKSLSEALNEINA